MNPHFRPSPAMVVAVVALVVALGGTSYAAITVTSKTVKNGSLTGTDIKNGSVSAKDIKNRSLTQKDVRKDSLGGRSVLESSLGLVPKAAHAASADQAASANIAKTANFARTATSARNADTVGGLKMTPFVYRSDATTTRRKLVLLGGLEVEASCTGANNDLFLVNRSGRTAELTITNVDQTDEDVSDDTEGKSNVALANDDDENAATFIPHDKTNGEAGFVTSANKSVRVLYTLNQNVNGFDCSISGLVIG